MQTIVFNHQSSKLSIEEEAIALKTGFLLADQPVSAGSTANELFIRNTFRNLSLTRKGEMMINFYDHEKEWCDALKETLRLLKTYASVKHKTKEMLAAQKKTEHMLNHCWNEMMTQVEERLNKTGFGTFRFLTSEPTVGYLPVGVNPENEDDFYCAVSELLRLKLDAPKQASPELEGSQCLFFPTSEFLSNDYAPPIFEASGSEARNPATCYLHHCFTLPYINQLSLAELQSVRNSLRTAGAAFRTSTDAWAGACYNGEDTARRVDLFLQIVVPGAAVLQKATENNEILSQCQRQYVQYPKWEVWMGEIPVGQLWNFYRDNNAIPDESWDILQAAKAEAEENGRWPVMVLKATAGIRAAETTLENMGEEIKGTRKYLVID